MENNIENFIQSNSPDGGFLQSEEWRKFQESVGRKTYNIADENFSASLIEHSLPIVGKYFYIPRGPVIPAEAGIQNNNLDSGSVAGMTQLINLARENKAGWIRVEPATERILNVIKAWTSNVQMQKGHLMSVKKAPHNMQPKEILMMDITKPEEELLAGMKSKTRYNIRLAEKKNVRVIGYQSLVINSKYIEEFIRLVKITSKRDKITPHPENYYRKMFEAIPDSILKLYIAEYGGETIAANLVLFYGEIATYFHGASDNKHRNLMAPYLLQWQAIKDAKESGYKKYDFGGVNTKTGEGITKFKTGFVPNVSPVEFPGSYDIIINSISYKLYRIMQKIKGYAK